MRSLVASDGWPTETALQRETINEVKFPHHNYPCCTFPRFLNIETAVIDAEIFKILRKAPIINFKKI
jgi:hypothetical protein